MVKQEEKLGFTNKEALEFMFENTVLYWYYALNKQFTDDENLNWETISPRMIKYFLIEFIEETKWKPEMLPVKKIKDLKKKEEECFIT